MADVSPQDPMVPPNTFGVRLAMLRAWKGWNVRQAAEQCGVPEQNWHNWEDGKSPQKLHEKARQIADRAPCDYVWLVAGVDSRPTRLEKSERHLRPVASPAKISRSAKNQTPLAVSVATV